jgi:hypothetical protein
MFYKYKANRLCIASACFIFSIKQIPLNFLKDLFRAIKALNSKRIITLFFKCFLVGQFDYLGG